MEICTGDFNYTLLLEMNELVIVIHEIIPCSCTEQICRAFHTQNNILLTLRSHCQQENFWLLLFFVFLSLYSALIPPKFTSHSFDENGKAVIKKVSK